MLSNLLAKKRQDFLLLFLIHRQQCCLLQLILPPFTGLLVPNTNLVNIESSTEEHPPPYTHTHTDTPPGFVPTGSSDHVFRQVSTLCQGGGVDDDVVRSITLNENLEFTFLPPKMLTCQPQIFFTNTSAYRLVKPLG